MVDLIRETTWSLEGPSADWRRQALARAREDHARLVADAPALALIEQGPPLAAVPVPERLRVAAWNTERLKQVEASAGLLRTLEPDVVLLSEVDLGMARSGNRRNAADLAALLGMTWVFGAEYVELGLGDQDERRTHAGLANAHGLHGNAILARVPIRDPLMIRLETEGAWFTGERKAQPRVGGRIALIGRIETAEGPVGVVSTHIESQSDPGHRGDQMQTLLSALERIDPDLPWLIGGDLNTNTVGDKSPGWQARAAAGAPDRLVDPVPYEPLFEVAREAGFGWSAANTLKVPTQRPGPGEPGRPLARLDWFLARGLRCTEPLTVPAVDAGGRALSDHELVAVTVARP